MSLARIFVGLERALILEWILVICGRFDMISCVVIYCCIGCLFIGVGFW